MSSCEGKLAVAGIELRSRRRARLCFAGGEKLSSCRGKAKRDDGVRVFHDASFTSNVAASNADSRGSELMRAFDLSGSKIPCCLFLLKIAIASVILHEAVCTTGRYSRHESLHRARQERRGRVAEGPSAR